MKISSSGIIYTVKDNNNRPLVILRHSKNVKILYILNRYVDMTEKDKDIIRVAYEVALKSSSQIDKGNISNIEDFLNFSENKPCG